MTGQDFLKIVQHESHVRIDLDRYAGNIHTLADLAGSERELMAAVKADGYGHGAVACAQTALENGATRLAVARIWEGIQLRESGIDAPILVLGGANPEAIGLAIENHLTLTAGSESIVAAIEKSVSGDRKAVVHLKIDTGLHRYGFLPEAAPAVAERLSRNPNVTLEGIYAHFSSADEIDRGPTESQLNVAHEVVDRLAADGITFKYIHLPNSAAILTGATGNSNLFRAGIVSYGLRPSSDVPLPDGIRPVMSIRGKLSRVFNLRRGEGVSYGLTYVAPEDELEGTISIGYADGLSRSVSNQGWFVVNGQRCPIHGRVCMDQTVVGLPAGAAEQDIVLIAGDGAHQEMTLDDIAELDGTINYEVATRFAARMPRVYIRNGDPVACDLPPSRQLLT